MKPRDHMTLIAGTLLLGLTSAQAGPCTDAIARFEQEVRAAARSDPQAGPSAQQSIGAQMEHQPTPESVARAKAEAQAGFEAVLAKAKALDAQGKPECAKLLEEARLIYFQ